MKANSPKTKTPKGVLLGSDLARSMTSKKTPTPPKHSASNGGQTTISPPAKVKLDTTNEARILVSGIDSLSLAMNVSWLNDGFFEYLGYMKKCAIEEEEDIPVFFKNKGSDENVFLVKPHGTNGYEWLMTGMEYSLKIGNWLQPIQRPSIMVEIRSEVLWRMGLINAIDNIVWMIENQKALVYDVKPSRVDICVDFLMPENIWSIDLIKYRTTRAGYASPHYFYDKLTGISVGKGVVSARLYDKPLEIKQKSKNKIWMYDVWGIKDVPDGMRIIRVEFQLRRGALKELNINTTTGLINNIERLWAYCTQRWLKFQNNPGKHHTQRKTFDWWKVVQNGFSSDWSGYPLIRHKALTQDSERLWKSSYGSFLSHLAVERELKGIDIGEPVTEDEIIKTFGEKFSEKMINGDDLTKMVYRKQARYHRSKQSERGCPDNSFSEEGSSDVPIDVFLKELSKRPLSFVDKMEKAEMESKKKNLGPLFDK